MRRSLLRCQQRELPSLPPAIAACIPVRTHDPMAGYEYSQVICGHGTGHGTSCPRHANSYRKLAVGHTGTGGNRQKCVPDP